jgi:hypothetical protein
MFSRRYGALAIAMVGVIGLAGCADNDGIAALDRAATSDDQLPGYVLTRGVDVDSVRKVAERDGVRYFISESETDEGHCVIQIKGQDESAWASVCGTGNLVTSRATGIVTSVALVTDSFATDDLEQEGWTKVHTNLFTN